MPSLLALSPVGFLSSDFPCWVCVCFHVFSYVGGLSPRLRKVPALTRLPGLRAPPDSGSAARRWLQCGHACVHGLPSCALHVPRPREPGVTRAPAITGRWCGPSSCALRALLHAGSEQLRPAGRPDVWWLGAAVFMQEVCSAVSAPNPASWRGAPCPPGLVSEHLFPRGGHAGVRITIFSAFSAHGPTSASAVARGGRSVFRRCMHVTALSAVTFSPTC